MLHCLRSVTECFSQRLGTNTVTTRTCPRGRPCGVPCADPLIRTRFKAATIASASRSSTNQADPGTADIPGAGRDLVPPGSSISPFSQDCGTRVSRQYLQMAAEGTPSDRIAAAMALHGSIALHIDLTRSTKASGSRGIRGFSRGHERIGTRSQPRSWTLATRVVRLRMHPSSARSTGLINS